MVSLVWQFAAFLFGLMAAVLLLFLIVTFFVLLIRAIVEYIKMS